MRSLDAMSFKILALETYMYKTLLAGALHQTLLTARHMHHAASSNTAHNLRIMQ